MPNSFTSPAKDLIRKQWNKPLLRFLKEQLNARLVYLGLPSPDAEDISEWIDFLDNVIAFQCRDYPNPSNPDEQSREAIEQLEAFLGVLERQSKLSGFTVFDGYIEEVILKGTDNVGIETAPLLEKELITVYNLDFCNSLTSPIEFIDSNGEFREGYKLDAVEKLLAFQSQIQSVSKRFLFFLTIHRSFEVARVSQFVKDSENQMFRNYFNKEINGLKSHEQKIRMLRLYVLENLNRLFFKHGFVPEFLPVVYYQGIGDNSFLLHFGVIGMNIEVFDNNFEKQISQKLISQKFVTTETNSFILAENPKIKEQDVEVNPVDFFTASESFRLW